MKLGNLPLFLLELQALPLYMLLLALKRSETGSCAEKYYRAGYPLKALLYQLYSLKTIFWPLLKLGHLGSRFDRAGRDTATGSKR